MAKVIPFRGLRYNTALFQNLDAVTAPPYDIISPAMQRELYAKSEYNVVRLDYGMELPEDDETHSRYTRSAQALEEWIAAQRLIYEEEPAFYIYEQVFSLGFGDSAHSLKGIISLVQLEEFSRKVVLPHEETIAGAKEDRLRLMEATRSNLSQVYSLYMDQEGQVGKLIDDNSRRDPDLSFVTQEGITQNVWIVTDPAVNARITGLFAEKQIFIADGHHRYETALNYRRERRAQDGSPEGSMSYDYIMMMLVSMSNSGLYVFPTHRMVRNLENFDEVLLVSLLTEEFHVSKIFFTEGDYADIIMERLGNTVDERLFGMYTGKNYYYLLKLKDLRSADKASPDRPEVYRRLDVTILHKLVLERNLGIDEESLRQQKNLVYTRDAHEAVDAAKNGKFDCVFLTNPPKIAEIKEIALLNEKMPQKSTYFWPKLVTGIVMNRFEN